MPNRKRESWKGWAIIVDGRHLYQARPYQSLLPTPVSGESVVRVTITVDAKRKKVKRG